MNNLKKTIALLALLSLYSILSAQIPAGYYSTATGTGYTLKTQLHNIINGHTSISYSALWTAYGNSDIDASDGYILDRYSENPTGADPYNFTYSTNQCGSYSGEGSCYNREHSFPKSWFGGTVAPMNSDIFHVVPSDGYVNGVRGNYPFGETNSPNYTSQNGCKRGPAVSGLGYSGVVFEPIDEYKGDFARIYFYMATRYENLISSWPGSVMLDGSNNQVFTTWALNMLLQWDANDPISQLEIDRNNYIYYNVQGNRNPYVDHSNYVNLVWGGGSVFCNATQNIYYCQGGSIVVNGQTISTPTTITDTVTGVSCDTIMTIIISQASILNTTLPNIEVCDGNSILIFGIPRSVAGTYQQTLTSVSTGCDSIISQSLIVNSNKTNAVSDVICNSNTYSFGGQIITSSGLYNHTFTTFKGCDSVVTLTLTLDNVDVSVTQNLNEFTANQNNANYKWLDCNDNYSPLQDEENQVFVTGKEGEYAVEIALNNCIDTSLCYLYEILGGVNQQFIKKIKLTPNPVLDRLEIEADIEIFEVQVVGVLGNKIVLSSKENSIDTAELKKGIYYVIIEFRNGRKVVKKMIKQ